MNKLNKFIFAICLQLVIIFLLILFRLVTLSFGTEVLLKIEPVDPRNPLRGDYVTFRYSGVSEVNPYSLTAQPPQGSEVYVILTESGKYWTAGSLQTTKPDDGTLYLRGRVASENRDDPTLRPTFLHVMYGIEEYFIPEGKGQNADIFSKDVAARVVVGPDGNAVLKGIIVDGKSWP